jgi:GST-like protein
MDTNEYTPPRVWKVHTDHGGKYALMNRPTAGARHQAELPRGKHPLQLYSQGTWNGIKVTVMLEELLALGVTRAEYDAWLIDILKNEQFGSGFVELNPNSKIPALVDYSAEQPVKVFESGAILLYLAEKFEAFIPREMPARMECLSWLFWQMGSTPYLGGGFAHFYRHAPVRLEYPIDRYAMEVKRQLDVLNRRLDGRRFLIGDDYTIADIAIFPWYGTLVLGWANDVREFLSTQEYPHVERWAGEIAQRPAVQRGRLVNRTQPGWPGGIRERHSHSDFPEVVNSELATR